MSKSFINDESVVILATTKTNVHIIQTNEALSASCSKCHSNIYWEFNDYMPEGGQWFCSSEEGCRTRFPNVPKKVIRSRFFLLREDENNIPLPNWVSLWSGYPERDLIIMTD